VEKHRTAERRLFQAGAVTTPLDFLGSLILLARTWVRDLGSLVMKGLDALVSCTDSLVA